MIPVIVEVVIKVVAVVVSAVVAVVVVTSLELQTNAQKVVFCIQFQNLTRHS